MHVPVTVEKHERKQTTLMKNPSETINFAANIEQSKVDLSADIVDSIIFTLAIILSYRYTLYAVTIAIII